MLILIRNLEDDTNNNDFMTEQELKEIIRKRYNCLGRRTGNKCKNFSFCKYGDGCYVSSILGCPADHYVDGYDDGASHRYDTPWISVKDRLPDYDEQVLVYNPDYDMYFNHRSDNPYVLTDSNGWCVLFPSDNITHWMPIPDLPNDKTE